MQARSQRLALPAILGSPIAAARLAPLQVLQRVNRLPDLAPERGFVAAKPFENSVIEVGQTNKAARKLWLETHPLHASADVLGDDSEKPGTANEVTAMSRQPREPRTAKRTQLPGTAT